MGKVKSNRLLGWESYFKKFLKRCTFDSSKLLTAQEIIHRSKKYSYQGLTKLVNRAYYKYKGGE